MPQTVHLILLVFAICCFAFSAMQPSGPPAWNRVVSLGLTALALSFLSF